MMFQILISTSSGERAVKITKDCYRFGKTSEIVLPVDEDHCVTFYRRNGEFFFSNRSSKPINVGRKLVPVNESVNWSPGKSADLGNNVVLKLKEVTRDRNISKVLSVEKAKAALSFGNDENQIVSDKVVAMLCGALLFFSLIKFLETLA